MYKPTPIFIHRHNLYLKFILFLAYYFYETFSVIAANELKMLIMAKVQWHSVWQDEPARGSAGGQRAHWAQGASSSGAGDSGEHTFRT